MVGSAEEGDEFGRSWQPTCQRCRNQPCSLSAPPERTPTQAPYSRFTTRQKVNSPVRGANGGRRLRRCRRRRGSGRSFRASLVAAPLLVSKRSAAAGRRDRRPHRRRRIGRRRWAVNLLAQVTSKLTTAGPGGLRIHQNIPGIAGTPEPGDRFGLSVTVPHSGSASAGWSSSARQERTSPASPTPDSSTRWATPSYPARRCCCARRPGERRAPASDGHLVDPLTTQRGSGR